MRSRSRRAARIVAIVGAGRVGCALGRLLHQKGWRIGSVVTRSLRTARAARRPIGSGKPQAGLSEAVLAADLILIATPDRAIAETARTLARFGESSRSGAKQAPRDKKQGKNKKKTGGENWRGKIVLHTSGALSSDILMPLASRGAAIGSLHPLQTFSGRTTPSLSGSTCVMEGSAAALRMARRICRELRGLPVVLPQGRKAAYHAGAALAAGDGLAVIEGGGGLLGAGGVLSRGARGA